MTGTPPPVPEPGSGDAGGSLTDEVDHEPYTSGSDRYVNFATDFLGLRIAESQKRILRAIADHQRVIIMSGNGPGKSFAVASALNGFLFTNADSIVLGTSGSYSQFVDTMWGPAANMFKQARDKYNLPGDVLGGQQPQLRIDEEWYAKVVSPRKPGELEGRHAEGVLVIVEEADKPYITHEHFASAGSSITDGNDRMIAIANPPEDEANVVVDKMQSDRWHQIQFTSFESHNIQVDLGRTDATKIPGLLDLVTVVGDWEAWNDIPWPGIEEQYPGDYPGFAEIKQRYLDGEIPESDVLEWVRPGFPEVEATVRHDPDKGMLVAARDGLDAQWYKRRGGVIPPDTAMVLRPWDVMDVEESENREPEVETAIPTGAGYDVARAGGDWNAFAAIHGDVLDMRDRWRGVDHTANERRVMNVASGWASKAAPPTLVVDAQGEGSGVADRIAGQYPDTVRFNAGEMALDEARFYDRWAEGLYHLGQFLKNGGVITGQYGDRLREELKVAARVVEFTERYYKSRGETVWKATPKDDIKDVLGRSPDCLDASMQAAWADGAEVSGGNSAFIISR